MQISEIGAKALIDRLTKDLPQPPQERLPHGIGEDAAVFASPGEEMESVMASHILLEGVHFHLNYTPVTHLGYKAVATTLSNLAAMGAKPLYITFSVGVTAHWEVEDLEDLYKGVHQAVERYGVALVGGDTSPSVAGFTIAVTAVGAVPKGKSIGRHGAQPNDLLCCTGNLGAAYMGLKALEREDAAYDGSEDFQHQLAGKEYLLQRQLAPIPRFDMVDMLSLVGVQPTAMMDITKGIARDLVALSQASGIGFRLYEEKLPIAPETVSMAEEMGINVMAAALHGGEDYELLFTVPLGMKDIVEQLQDVSIIGYATDESEPCRVITLTGSEVTLEAE